MKLFSTLIVVLASICVFAQEPTITWQELSKDESQFKGIVTEPGTSNFIKLSLQKEGKKKNVKWNAFLTRYDASLKAMQSAALTNPADDGKFEYLLQVGGKMYVVFCKEEQDRLYSFSAQQVDPASLQLTGKLINIGTFKVMGDESVLPKPFLLPEDGKGILFFGFTDDEKTGVTNYTLVQYGENMEEKWRKILQNQKDESQRMLALTNKGVAICAKFEPASGKSLEKKVKLLHVSGSSIDEVPLETGGQFINVLKVINETAGGYQLFGLFAQVAGRGHSGYFTANVDAAQKQATITIKENFDLSLLQRLAKQEEAFNQPLHAIGAFRPLYVSGQANGDVHVMLENRSRDPLQHIRDSRNLGKRIIPESDIVWLNQSILDIVLRKNGSSQVNLFSKQQYSDGTDRLGSGFAFLAPGKDLHFFYNGWRKNIENDNPVERSSFGFSDYTRTSFVMATMESDGTAQRKVLFDNKPNGFYPAVVHFYKVNDKKMIVVGQTALDPQDVSKEVLGILELK